MGWEMVGELLLILIPYKVPSFCALEITLDKYLEINKTSKGIYNHLI